MTCLSHMHGDSDQETLDQVDCKPLSGTTVREAEGSQGKPFNQKRNDSRQEPNEFRIQMS